MSEARIHTIPSKRMKEATEKQKAIQEARREARRRPRGGA